jgi:hypothetical protein
VEAVLSQSFARRWPVQLCGFALGCLISLFAATAPARAEGPEQLEQLEPEGGEWQAEYSSLIGARSEDEHSLQILFGVSDHWAIGVEAEAEWSAGRLSFEGVSPTILYRFSDPSKGIGIGIGAQIELDNDLAMALAEARLILEKKTERWWGQGNLVARHVREDGESGAALAYAWGLSRSIGQDLWIGAEGSGWGGRLSASALAIPKGGHFVGPALSVEREIGGSEVEIGVAWQHRIAGQGPPDAARVTVQLDF